MKILNTQRARFLTVVLLFLLLPVISCISNTALVDVHGFSNLVLDKDTLWFGAGYKLYRVDLNQKTAAIVYDTGDVPIFFVQIDETRLFLVVVDLGKKYSGRLIWIKKIFCGHINLAKSFSPRVPTFHTH